MRLKGQREVGVTRAQERVTWRSPSAEEPCPAVEGFGNPANKGPGKSIP